MSRMSEVAAYTGFIGLTVVVSPPDLEKKNLPALQKTACSQELKIKIILNVVSAKCCS